MSSLPDPRVITEDVDFPIKPSYIDASKILYQAFGDVNTEISACYIVRLMITKGDWLPFTYSEINAFYKKKNKENSGANFYMLDLLGLGFVVREGEERISLFDIQDSDVFRVTDQFVCRAFLARPLVRMKAHSQPVG